MPVENKIFGNRIKALRIKKGLNQAQLAALLGGKATWICNWENHLSTPNFAVFCHLADILSVSLDYLAGRTDEPRVRKPKKAGDDMAKD